jgi:hypothetical protein
MDPFGLRADLDPASIVSMPNDDAKPEPPTRSPRATRRSQVILRAIAALGENTVLMILAATITIGSGLLAWS